MKITREKIIEAARELLGCPFHPQGRNPRFGIDCVFIPIYLFERFKIPYRDIQGYGLNDFETLLEQLKKSLTLSHGDGDPGDLIAYRLRRTSHVGLLTDTGILEVGHEECHEIVFDRRILNHPHFLFTFKGVKPWRR